MSFSLELLIGVLAVIAAITVPLIIYFLQKSKKRLAYEIISDTQLVGVDSEVQNKIKIYYEDKLVENVHLIVIRFINNGNQPISIDDFAKQINIGLGNNTNILTCEVLEQNPKNLDVNIIKMQDSIEVRSLLLNSKDSFTLNVLLSNYKRKLEISARVKGINQIDVYREPQLVPSLIVLSVIGFPMVLFILNFAFRDTVESYFGFNSEVLAYVLISPIFILIFYSMILTFFEAIKYFFIRKIREISSTENKK